MESKVGINTPNVMFLRKNRPGISSQTVGKLTEFSQVNPKSCAKKVVSFHRGWRVLNPKIV